MQYLVPQNLGEAIRFREQTGFPILAGGTDLYPAIEQGVRVEGLIDISRVAVLSEPIRCVGESWIVPALTTWTDVIDAQLPAQFDALKQAAREIGGRQIQNTGTIGGNLCNASPAADGITALLALDAAVVLAGASSEREMPLTDFVRGNRRCSLDANEILRAVRVPACRARHASIFRKLGARRYLVISIVMVSILIELDDEERVRRAHIAVGACADRALRLPDAEGRLCGMHVRDVARHVMTDVDLAPLAPIDDIRGSAAFRRHAVKVLIEEVLRDISKELTA